MSRKWKGYRSKIWRTRDADLQIVLQGSLDSRLRRGDVSIVNQKDGEDGLFEQAQCVEKAGWLNPNITGYG